MCAEKSLDKRTIYYSVACSIFQLHCRRWVSLRKHWILFHISWHAFPNSIPFTVFLVSRFSPHTSRVAEIFNKNISQFFAGSRFSLIETISFFRCLRLNVNTFPILSPLEFSVKFNIIAFSIYPSSSLHWT